jgi:hypothetical protein
MRKRLQTSEIFATSQAREHEIASRRSSKSSRKVKSIRIEKRRSLRQLFSGPDYLLDIALIEAIIWQAEVIDSSFGAQIREILNKAVRDQPDLVSFVSTDLT